jgi:hypothetical protein
MGEGLGRCTVGVQAPATRTSTANTGKNEERVSMRATKFIVGNVWARPADWSRIFYWGQMWTGGFGGTAIHPSSVSCPPSRVLSLMATPLLILDKKASSSSHSRPSSLALTPATDRPHWMQLLRPRQGARQCDLEGTLLPQADPTLPALLNPRGKAPDP